jgi:hypothetical protein
MAKWVALGMLLYSVQNADWTPTNVVCGVPQMDAFFSPETHHSCDDKQTKN